ncbi:MerR family transcriptional regulator [Streptomyces sp. enrichment culture]|uniref:MerR family transcriptional regulator n=1 Tax=Streptomyces sp. enrichment culture TaxID=1795815 RepID=UPI003F5483A3
MALLTIGAFARAARLSAKALRRYDELGLLRPVRVDPCSGYRYYAPEQLERARLVAWLRRIGMPLARIGAVCDLYDASDPAGAAREVRAYWARVEADTAARRDLASFLVDHLSGHLPGNGEQTMTTTREPTIRYAAVTDRGLVRETNQDAAYAGERLLAVADGYGASGADAGAAAIEALRPLEAAATGRAGDLLNALEDAVLRANEAVRGYAGSGTTLTAMLWTGSRLALVHVGDSRAYLLRDGRLYRVTHDHTVVQAMVDEGRLTPEEAASHPQRALLLRALDGAEESGRAPEVRLQEARAGDRYLLCSDGLSAVVPEERILDVLASAATPEDAARRLVAAAHEHGAPDNTTCAVAHVTG